MFQLTAYHIPEFEEDTAEESPKNGMTSVNRPSSPSRGPRTNSSPGMMN